MQINRFQKEYSLKTTPAADAVAEIADGAIVCSAMAVGQPPAILSALADRLRSGNLPSIRFYYKIGMQPISDSLLAPDVLPKIDAHCFFLSETDHQVVKKQAGTKHKLLSFVPVHFSEVPSLFEEVIDLDVFVATVSPMDAGGYFSFGTNNDYTSVAARKCKRLIIEVNKNMPRVFGQSQIHVREVDAIVENTVPLVQVIDPSPSEEGRTIGALVTPYIPNGATIQLGIGRVPSGITEALMQHEDLGIHTELFSPAMARLIDNGNINGSRKTLHPHKHVYTVAFGVNDTYALMNDNSAFESYPSSYVNDIGVISQNDLFISINTAIELDLYGQVNAEFIGKHQYSGSGGQFDFVKGSSLSKNGKSIIALQSTALAGNVSTIVPRVPMVTDLRMDAEYICTEYGIVNLRGKSTKERAEALISIAHPKFRDELTEAARNITLI